MKTKNKIAPTSRADQLIIDLHRQYPNDTPEQAERRFAEHVLKDPDLKAEVARWYFNFKSSH